MSEYFRKYIKKEHFGVHPSQIKYKTTFKNCVLEAFKKRGWREAGDEGDWDINWSDKEWIHDIMDHQHLSNNQKVNHYRNHYELTRKDLMVKNLKRYKKTLEKEGKLDEAAAYNFYPTTYNLPGEYSLFCEEFKKNTQIWIMKPIGKAQGKGIFLFKKLSEVSQWKNDSRWRQDGPSVESYIVQKYIANPLLIGGKKFDMRIYALVTSYSPLTVHLYRNGFARFTHHRYDMDDISNSYVHLTNVAIQKNSDNYDEKLGGKWDLRTLKLYLMSRYGQEKVSECFGNIQQTVIRTLQSVQKVVMNDKHCFELYGFDVLLDSNLKPWLIEVNSSPSMTANTPQDFELKVNMLDDCFSVLDCEKILSGQEDQIGGFDLICKGTPVKNESTLFSTMLGSHNNRSQQLKKLAKLLAGRLAQSYAQEKEDAKKKTYGGKNVMKNSKQPVQRPVLSKQNTTSFNKDQKDPANKNMMRNKVGTASSKVKTNLPPVGPNSQSVAPGTSAAGSSNLLQKSASPGVSTANGNSPAISQKSYISNKASTPSYSSNKYGKPSSTPQNQSIDANSEIYNYDVDRPSTIKSDKVGNLESGRTNDQDSTAVDDKANSRNSIEEKSKSGGEYE